MKHFKVRMSFIALLLILLGTVSELAFADSQTYTVVRGDTLTKIAIQFNTSVTALMRANSIRNPNRIEVGQRLTIPDAAPTSPGSPKPPLNVPVYTPPSKGAKWIDVNLSKQTMTAFEGNTPVFTTLVSTGTRAHPTVTGRFQIYVKIRSAPMSGGSRARGDYYYLPAVPNIMYFYQGYAIHGAYWHNNFGRVMSHGCINENLTDAKWFFDWAGPYMAPGASVVYASPQNPGTTVIVHY